MIVERKKKYTNKTAWLYEKKESDWNENHYGNKWAIFIFKLRKLNTQPYIYIYKIK